METRVLEKPTTTAKVVATLYSLATPVLEAGIIAASTYGGYDGKEDCRNITDSKLLQKEIKHDFVLLTSYVNIGFMTKATIDTSYFIYSRWNVLQNLKLTIMDKIVLGLTVSAGVAGLTSGVVSAFYSKDVFQPGDEKYNAEKHILVSGLCAAGYDLGSHAVRGLLGWMTQPKEIVKVDCSDGFEDILSSDESDDQENTNINTTNIGYGSKGK